MYKVELRECFIDGTIVVAKKWDNGGEDQVGKGTKLMAVADGCVPVSDEPSQA